MFVFGEVAFENKVIYRILNETQQLVLGSFFSRIRLSHAKPNQSE